MGHACLARARKDHQRRNAFSVSAIFDHLIQKFASNVYGSLKGQIRLQLLLADLFDYLPSFARSNLRVLDIGCGGGQFAHFCLELGHSVKLCDESPQMIQKALERAQSSGYGSKVSAVVEDFLSLDSCRGEHYDLVLLHGSAEWMVDPDEAVSKACQCVGPGGVLSLLLFNQAKYMLKKGINGHLVEAVKPRPGSLTPPGGRKPDQVISLLQQQGGEILLQSGIRIFQGFFRQIDPETLSVDGWIEQERRHYRTSPFSSLGEHTHFLWRREKRS